MKKLKPRKDNKEDRMNFVEYWADYDSRTQENYLL